MIVNSNFRIIEDFLLTTDRLLGFTEGLETDILDEVMRSICPDLYKDSQHKQRDKLQQILYKNMNI